MNEHIFYCFPLCLLISWSGHAAITYDCLVVMGNYGKPQLSTQIWSDEEKHWAGPACDSSLQICREYTPCPAMGLTNLHTNKNPLRGKNFFDLSLRWKEMHLVTAKREKKEKSGQLRLTWDTLRRLWHPKFFGFFLPPKILVFHLLHVWTLLKGRDLFRSYIRKNK